MALVVSRVFRSLNIRKRSGKEENADREEEWRQKRESIEVTKRANKQHEDGLRCPERMRHDIQLEKYTIAVNKG